MGVKNPPYFHTQNQFVGKNINGCKRCYVFLLAKFPLIPVFYGNNIDSFKKLENEEEEEDS